MQKSIIQSRVDCSPKACFVNIDRFGVYDDDYGRQKSGSVSCLRHLRR